MFGVDAERLARKHATSGLLIDTNLLLLLLVGRYDPRRVSSFKRTMKYSRREFGLMQEYVSRFKTLWTTPQILTETDNLGRQLGSHEHKAFAAHVRGFIRDGSEAIINSKQAAEHEVFPRLGYCDTTTLLKSKDCLLISDDLPLYLAVTGAGCDVINFNHIRL